MLILAGILLAVPLGVFAGYPALLLVAAALRPARRVAAGEVPASATVLISAFNEAAHIAAKLDSVLMAAQAWPGRCEIIVGDDGSSDGTAAIVAGYADRGVRLVARARGGKAAVLNAIAPLASGEVLVLTDADPLFDRATLPALLAPFADAQVGAVAGRVETLRAKKRSRFAAADRLFRGYEAAIRRAEDRLFGCVSADGGVLAIRRDLMPVVLPTVTDDFWISTAAVSAGKRIAYADDARVFEHSISGNRQQLRRRVRITVRGLTALWHRRALMNPARTGWYAVGLIAHKLARRLAPLALAPLWGVALALAVQGSTFWALIAAGLTGLFALGLIGFFTPGAMPRLLSPVYGLVLHLAGLAAGVALFAVGRRYAQWTPQKAGAA